MGRSLARNHAEKRAAILKAAARVFARDGVAGASMAGVAEEAGTSKANLYHYWDGKDALLFDVLDSYLSRLRDVIRENKASLDGLLTAILLAYEGMDDEHRIQSEGTARLDAPRVAVLKGYQRDMVAVLEQALMRAIPTLDPTKKRDAAMSVFGMLNWFYMWAPGADAAARRAYARDVAAIATGGVSELGRAG